MNTLKTGIKSLDKKLNGGLRSGSLTVITSRPGNGKYFLQRQIADNITKCGKSILFLALEMSIDDVAQKIESLKNCAAVFIENFLLIRSRKGAFEDRTQERANIASELKHLAEKHDVPIVVVAQIRDGFSDRFLLIKDIRKAGFHEQNTDVIIFPYIASSIKKFPGKYEKDQLIIGENKYGETAAITVHWNEEKMIFEDI